MAFLDKEGLSHLWAHIISRLNGKVDKEDGKGLSSNDYTDTEKSKLSSVEDNANNYVHPDTHSAGMITGLADVATSGSYNDLSNKPTIPTIPSSLPADGGNADTVDGKHATDFASATHTHSEYVNQNAFSNVKVGSTTVASDTTTDTLTLVAGDNITITPDATNDKITISSTDTNTTYSSGTGLSLSGTTFNHSNSVTAGTAKGDDNKTLTFGSTFTIPSITYDAQGHITGKSTTTMTMPTNPNTDTHYTTHLKVGASSSATANAAATNGNVYMNVLDDSTIRDSHNIVGSGATTVTSDANGKITINSPESAVGVRDYNSTSSIIKVGFAGAGLTVDEVTHVAAYSGANKIKDLAFPRLCEKIQNVVSNSDEYTSCCGRKTNTNGVNGCTIYLDYWKFGKIVICNTEILSIGSGDPTFTPGNSYTYNDMIPYNPASSFYIPVFNSSSTSSGTPSHIYNLTANSSSLTVSAISSDAVFSGMFVYYTNE